MKRAAVGVGYALLVVLLGAALGVSWFLLGYAIAR